MEFLAGFFTAIATFGIWFWLLIFVEIGFLCYFVEVDENGFGATFSFILFGVLLYWFWDVHPLRFAFENPDKIFFIILSYLVAGVGWSFGKWCSFLQKEHKHFLKKKEDLILRTGLVWEDLKKDKDQMRSTFGWNGLDGVIPKAGNNKGNIIRWMVYWPVSLFWAITHDLIIKVYNFIYDMMVNSYDNIAKRIFKDV